LAKERGIKKGTPIKKYRGRPSLCDREFRMYNGTAGVLHKLELEGARRFRSLAKCRVKSVEKSTCRKLDGALSRGPGGETGK